MTQHVRHLLGLYPAQSHNSGTGLDQSLPQPSRFHGRLTTGHHSGMAHISGMVAHIAGIRQQGNETMETK